MADESHAEARFTLTPRWWRPITDRLAVVVAVLCADVRLLVDLKCKSSGLAARIVMWGYRFKLERAP